MEKLHDRFVRYGKNARYWMRRCEMLLPEINKQEIWRKKGYGDVYEYAAKLAGMNHNKVNECLRIMKHIEDKPELLKVAEEKGLGAVKPVATIATQEDAEFWAEKSETMSKNELEVYVREYRCEEVLPRKEKVEMELDPKVADMLKKMKGDKDWNTFMRELMDGQAKPEPAQTKQIPIRIKEYVKEKTNGLCAHPGCNKPAEEFHHTERQALTEGHDPKHIHALCEAHHQLAHHGLIENEEKQPYEWGILDNPDTTSPKYRIDQLVQKYKTG